MIARYVKRFVVYIEPVNLTDTTSDHITWYYEYLKLFPCNGKTGYLSEKTMHDHIYSLRVLFNWFEITGEMKQNPISGLPFKQPSINVRKPLNIEQVKVLFDKASLKEKALLHLLYSCGLRRSEAVSLNLNDYYPKLNVVVVRSGKGKKRRVIPISEKVKNDLSEYQHSIYRNKRVNSGTPFMLNNNGSRMLGGSFDKILKKVVGRTNIVQIVTPHVLRHSIATHLLDNGCNLEFVRDFLGHRYIDTTQIYTHITGKIKVSNG